MLINRIFNLDVLKREIERNNTASGSLWKRTILVLLLLVLNGIYLSAQTLPGFRESGTFSEQQMVIENSKLGTRILINAPLQGFGKKDKVLLVFFALPNGNTIEQTMGKKLQQGDDWHFNIQHIAAQTRFIRHHIRNRTVVTAYVESRQKSWPAWVAATKDSVNAIKKIVEDTKNLFSKWKPELVLNGHSGGGRFIFSYINAVKVIPEEVVRIAFLDSDYGYEDSICGPKLTTWLKSGKNNFLCTLAYNDSVVIYNGKPLVSPTGGTWYRSRMMLKFLSGTFRFKHKDMDTLKWNSALNRRIEIILKTNPDNKIFHTTQVERNGFIHSMQSGTRQENKGYTYFGNRAYSEFIGDSLNIPIRRLNIPVRETESESGSAFMKRIDPLSLKEREEEIFKAISAGNIPEFLRNTHVLKAEFADSAGTIHKVVLEVMPDYLAVGNDQDFCRIPMNPYTAQRLADAFGASLLTAKLSDYIYRVADIKLVPYNYVPVGNANELVSKFVDHNAQIERQLRESGGTRGNLVAGIQKDIILSNRIKAQPGKVVIYGWHKQDGKPIQPVYSGHVWWYVDYSHGIRLINKQILIDEKPMLLSDVLKDPLLYKLFSDEDKPMEVTGY
ncbi:MAG: hypothetical protein WCK18_03340 [Prolixibacteraceae bacterium]